MNDLGKQLNKSKSAARLIELIEDMSEEERESLLKKLEDRVFEGRRKHLRKPFFMVVDYATQHAAYKDFIRNISAGGVFIETSAPFSTGQEVTLTFPFPKSQKHVKATGEIVRTSAQGIGVELRIADQQEEAKMKWLLEMI